MAQRLVERGVRFIQLYSGGSHNDANWDAHGDLVKNHNFHAANTDKPIAALLADLKQYGLLDETVVVWGANSVVSRQPSTPWARDTINSWSASNTWSRFAKSESLFGSSPS